jgi:hypothetical protein
MPIGAPLSNQFVNVMNATTGPFGVTGRAATLSVALAGTAGTWPEDEFDARFASNQVLAAGSIRVIDGTVVTNKTISGYGTGDPTFGYGDYTIRDCCIKDVGEGPRISGPNITIDGCYIRLTNNVPNDHGDAIQAYNSTSGSSADWGNIVIRNTKIVVNPGNINCGLFCADRPGVRIKLENVSFVIAPDCPHGAIYMPNTRDTVWGLGVRSVDFNNVLVSGGQNSATGVIGIGRGVGPDAGVSGVINPTVLQWTNVRNTNGTVYTPTSVGMV